MFKPFSHPLSQMIKLVFLHSGAAGLSPDGAGNEGRARHKFGLRPGGIITAFLLKSIKVFPKKASYSELHLQHNI